MSFPPMVARSCWYCREHAVRCIPSIALFLATQRSFYPGAQWRAAARLATIAGVLLSGCATYQARPLAPQARLELFEARRLEDPELRRYITYHLAGPTATESARPWDLTTLILAAFYFSPELDVARAQSGVSVAAIHTAGQHPNPSLQIPLGYTSNAKDGESPYTFGLGLDIPIETAGKRGYRVAQAQHLSEAARFRIGSVAWQVRSRVRKQLLALYAATGQAVSLDQQLAAQQQVVNMLDKRLAVGAVSEPEANHARANLVQRRLELGNAQRQIADARAQLASTIGLPVVAMANVKFDFHIFERVALDLPESAMRNRAVLNRADLLEALADYEASQSVLQLQIANQYPDIHLGPGYSFDAGSHKYSLQVSGISLPIFNHNRGPIAEATARRIEMAARVDARQMQAVNDIDRAIENYRKALANLRLAGKLLSAQTRQQRTVQASFDAGKADRLALTSAGLELERQQLDQQQALIQVQQTIGDAEDAMQRPFSRQELRFEPNEGRTHP
ncbi:MAG: TolC family protein [Burkholderiaceae bacterium]